MTIEEMYQQLREAERDVVFARMLYFKKREELTAIETDLIEKREAVRRLYDRIEAYKLEFDMSQTETDVYDAEVKRFKAALPGLLEKIKDEPPIPPVDILADRS